MDRSDLPIITKSRIVSDLRDLGLSAGQIIMLHASIKAIGWIVGGPDVVLDAVLEVLAPTGTVMMMAGWEDNPYHLADWPPERQQAYLMECPAFDPATSRAERAWSILTEYLRTRLGAARSRHPEQSMVALGAQAKWLVSDHAFQHGFGPGSPLEKFAEAGGRVLLLGSPLSNVTVLHYAEYLAQIPNKRAVRYQMPILLDGRREWVWIEELDSSNGIADWDGEDYFELIVRAHLESGQARQGIVGAASSYLLDAALLVEEGARWMERNLTLFDPKQAIIDA